MPKQLFARHEEFLNRHFGRCADRTLVRYIGKRYKGAFKLLEDD